MKKMDAADDTFDKQKSEWQNKICELESALNKTRDSYHAVKARRRHQATAEELKRNKLKDEIHELNEWILELDNAREAAEAETRKANKETRQVNKKYIRAKDDAYSRLVKLRNETLARRAKEDELTHVTKALSRSETDLGIMRHILGTPQETKRVMKKEWDDKDNDGHQTRRGGSRRWPTWVVLMICELLINGTRPSAVLSCIHTVYKMLYLEAPKELPCINFMRECRVLVEVMGETITAIKLANATQWSQLWTDSTTRRQIPFTALIIGVLAESGNVDPVVVSLCIFMEDETSEMQADGIVKKVNTRLHYV